MTDSIPTRDELASLYLDQLPFDPYPVQEEALLAWFTAEQGVLVCAPTGTGKTLIAEAALFEALHTRRTAYYTTPLIALTEQKFQEMQKAAVEWGFSKNDVGLVTGNRSVNPQATVLVVVAEILLNRLLHPTAFDFSEVSAVVMDEFHNFADAERGIVWELSLGLLPAHIRLLLLSATVGNSSEFVGWLRKNHGRKMQLVQSTDRKVPLRYSWVPDQLLNEQLQLMADGDEETRKTPALLFCFNREQCWSVAEQLKGKHLLDKDRQKQLTAELGNYDWSQGAGPKLRQVLLRGVGVHHAGLLPRYKRIVEDLFQRKLLTVTVCTETLAAGMNLPARSVVLTTLVKGPPGDKKLIDASSAHQMFGRAGRPQFDTEGYVYALTHEDDVKIARWKEKYDTIPEDTKDPLLIKAKKKIKKKMPKRRTTEQYWSETQFQKLIIAPPGKLYSKGPIPWRLLAYLLEISPDVEQLKTVLSKRLMDQKRVEAAQRQLTRMLKTLWAGGYVTLEPEPPAEKVEDKSADSANASEQNEAQPKSPVSAFAALLLEARATKLEKSSATGKKGAADASAATSPEREHYEPRLAHPTPELHQLIVFRSIHPIYGAFLTQQLGIADRDERIQALESVLNLPGSMAKHVRVPKHDRLPPGPLATTRLDAQLIDRGLVTADQLTQNDDDDRPFHERTWVLPFAEKLHMLFTSEFPEVKDVRIRPVWVAGDLLTFGSRFDNYIKGRQLAKQEGIIFRHLLRLILLCGEFMQVCPPETTLEEWQDDLRDISDQLTAACREIEPDSTDKAIEAANAVPDVVAGEVADG